MRKSWPSRGLVIVLALWCLDAAAKNSIPTPSVSTGIIYTSRTDSARLMAANLLWPEGLNLAATLGLPVGEGQSLAGIGAATFSYREWVGVGGAAHWTNPGLSWRGGLGVRVPGLVVPGITLGATLISEGGYDADLSTTVRIQSLALAALMHSAIDGIDAMTFGVGSEIGLVHFEVDTEYETTGNKDLFFIPGLGLRFPRFEIGARYYVSFASTESTSSSARSLAAGELSLGASYEAFKNFEIQGLYHYDPNTYDLAIQYRF